MISLFTFIGVAFLLSIQGFLIADILLHRTDRALAIALALPIAALSNVSLIYILTVVRLPLHAMTLIPGHLLIIGTAWWIRRMTTYVPPPQSKTCDAQVSPGTIGGNSINALSIIVLACIGIYAVTHAVLLPTFQYDSATNWTMRSQISFYDQAIAFDPTEARGMAKPQYPVLFHMLQLTANTGQKTWNDIAANGILLLWTAGLLASLHLLLRNHDRHMALPMIAAMVSTPLIAVHMAQGYADINLLLELTVALASLALYFQAPARTKMHTDRWLWLSALFIVAGVWTKSEGWFFGTVPWLLLLTLYAWKHRTALRSIVIAAVSAIVLSLPWYLLLWAKGLNLTPHSSDTLFTFHIEGVTEVLQGLWSRGSFGILWYLLPAALLIIGILAWRKNTVINRRQLSLPAWGGIVFFEVLFIYLCTPNIVFLMNAQSFYRQMMIPGALLLIGCGLCIDWNKKVLRDR